MLLWNMLLQKCRCSEEHHDIALYSCEALTNLHVFDGALRAGDGEFYRNYKTCLLDPGTNTMQKRTVLPMTNKGKLELDLNVQFWSLDDDNTQAL